MQVGIGDPHGVVFHLPIESKSLHDHNFHLGMSISDELLVAIMRLLKKYLMDDSVKIIDMASQALRVSQHMINCVILFQADLCQTPYFHLALLFKRFHHSSMF